MIYHVSLNFRRFKNLDLFFVQLNEQILWFKSDRTHNLSPTNLVKTATLAHLKDGLFRREFSEQFEAFRDMRKKKKKKKELIENSIQKNTDLLDFFFVEMIFVDGWQIAAWNSKIGGFFQPFILGCPPFPVNSHHQEEFLHFSVTGDPNPNNPSFATIFLGRVTNPTFLKLKRPLKLMCFFKFFSDSE